MPIQPVFESITLQEKEPRFRGVVKAETEFNINGGIKVLNLSAWASVTDHKKDADGLAFSGKIVYYLCYRDENGEIRKAEKAGAFSGVYPLGDLAENDFPIFSCAVDKTEWNADGDNMSVAAYLTVAVKVRAQREETFLGGGDGVIIKKEEAESLKSYGIKKTAFSVEEEFDLNYPILEVLLQSVSARITAAQCGVGTVIADGEVFLSILCLQKNEEGGIIKENKVSSFRAEIEYEEAMPTTSAIADAILSSYKTEVSVDAESGKSTVIFTANLSICGEVTEKETVSFCSDAFSVAEETEIATGERALVSERGAFSEMRRATGVVNGDGLPDNYKIIAACGEKFEPTEFSVESGTAKVEGVLSAVLFLESDGKITTRKKETAVNFTFPCDVVDGADSEITAFAVNCVAMETGGNIELSADIAIRVEFLKENKIKFIKDIKGVGEKQIKDAAISVYIPVRGESLWSLAKRLSVCPEELVATNKDLNFPLDGTERIIVYRNK